MVSSNLAVQTIEVKCNVCVKRTDHAQLSLRTLVLDMEINLVFQLATRGHDEVAIRRSRSMAALSECAQVHQHADNFVISIINHYSDLRLAKKITQHALPSCSTPG